MKTTSHCGRGTAGQAYVRYDVTVDKLDACDMHLGAIGHASFCGLQAPYETLGPCLNSIKVHLACLVN